MIYRSPQSCIERCLWLAGYFMRFGRMRSLEVIPRLGVPERTFRRDIDRLRSAGFRIVAVRIAGTWELKLHGFDPDFADRIRKAAA